VQIRDKKQRCVYVVVPEHVMNLSDLYWRSGSGQQDVLKLQH
jgi:hypothetical protein